jgi:hypothetical protein
LFDSEAVGFQIVAQTVLNLLGESFKELCVLLHIRLEAALRGAQGDYLLKIDSDVGSQKGVCHLVRFWSGGVVAGGYTQEKSE